MHVSVSVSVHERHRGREKEESENVVSEFLLCREETTAVDDMDEELTSSLLLCVG